MNKQSNGDLFGKTIPNVVSKKKKVLLVHNYYQIGGGEHTVFENEKQMLQEHGHEIHTYTRSNDELKTAKWKLALLPFTTTWSFRTYFEVRKLIREKGIDIVHCHNTFPLISPSVYYAARSCKVPVVQTIHNFRFLCPNGLFYCHGQICEKCREQKSFMPALKNKCYRSSAVQTAVAVVMLQIHRWLGTYNKINYIFLTEFNKSKFADLIDIRGENIFDKPNFVKGLSEPKVLQMVKSKFVYAGRLDENKGVPFLLDAWDDLPEEYELHIYGDGTYREACEEAAKQHPNIHYWGFRPQKEIFDNLKESAALLFPSIWYEGFPMILAESFSVGRPIVCANLGNHGDVVRASGGGALYEAGNKESFQKALSDVVTNNKSYAACASRYYQERLTPERNYEILSTIYDKAAHTGELPPRVDVIGVPISAVTMDAALNYVAGNLENLRGQYVCASNVHTTVMAREDAYYLAVQSESIMSLPDGKPLSVVGRKKAPCPMEKVTGTHFMQNIFTDARFAGKRHYFYGTSGEDLEQMIEKVREDYPQLNICGYEPSIFRELSDMEVEELAQRINKAQADFIWVAIGAPRQEKLMYRLKDKVNGLMTGVGGAFNILAGRVNDAPRWMQNMGLEWFYRLIKEPKRLFKRYLITNSKYLCYLIWRK